MPLQNRVNPFGDLFATPARGALFGNRGGKFHRDGQTLGLRRWASRRWICCVLSFKGRQRNVWGRYYTELFFLDEVTAFAAGHRPCFECRRKDAERFALLFAAGPHRATAAEMDRQLHRERLDGTAKRAHRRAVDELPAGAMIARGNDAYALSQDEMLSWSPEGYTARESRPRTTDVAVLTPPSVLHVPARGYA